MQCKMEVKLRWECYNPNIKLCEIYYCKIEDTTNMQHESKLKCYGMRECRQEIEVIHKAPKKPVRKPAT